MTEVLEDVKTLACAGDILKLTILRRCRIVSGKLPRVYVEDVLPVSESMSNNYCRGMPLEGRHHQCRRTRHDR